RRTSSPRMVVSAPAEPLPVVAAEDAPVAITPHRSDAVRREVLLGVMFGVVSAVCYTGTNIALRGVTRGGDPDWAIWVTCLKSLPSALSAWLILGGRAVRGLPALPTARTAGLLLGLGLIVQGGGNLFFQWSLAMCGLALAVPTVFATLILTGAALGRFWLGEAVTARSAVAMGLLIAAIGLLSLGAEGAAAALPPGPPDVSPVWWVLQGVLLSALAGVFYGALGVVIRQTTRDSVPLPATLALVSTTGVVGLGIPAVIRLGPEILTASASEWTLMLVAGTLNAIAFFAIGGSLRRIPVVQVNLLNASQAALCALGGVLVYGEPLTAALVGGTALTVAGLVLMSRRSGAEARK
ncbi:MAG TPA: DMT family transporter, partial [Planctomycetaceae bacterium]